MKDFIGIDIGGTSTKVALVNQSGEYSNLSRVYYDAPELTIKCFLEKVTDITDNLVNSGLNLSGIGISSPGLQMENGHGTLISSNMPMLNKFDLMDFFMGRYKTKVVVSNDMVAHGFAESHFGSGKAVERFLSISMGTGIGHTFIYRRKPVLSMNGISGDSGRMVIDPYEEAADLSGISGSVEALCGVKAIEILGQNHYSVANQYTAKEIITRAREEHDPIAIEIMSLISRRLALLLINLSSIYFPEVISITGGQTEAGLFFIEECQKEFDRRAGIFFNDIGKSLGKQQRIKIYKSKAGGLAGLIGSIVPLLDEL